MCLTQFRCQSCAIRGKCRDSGWIEFRLSDVALDCHVELNIKSRWGCIFRRAIARLVPSVCGTLPPREGGLHVRLCHRIVHHAMAKQLSLS